MEDDELLQGVGPLELLVFQPTTLCNLDCSYCYLSSESRAQAHSMTPEVVRDAVRFVRSTGLVKDRLRVVWHLGEPLTAGMDYYRTAVPLIVDGFSDVPLLSLGIQTNATLITQAWCDLFNEYGMQVGVSIDGPEPLHDVSRTNRQGRGSFRSVMRGLALLKKNGIPFSTISVVTARSLERPGELFEFLADLDPVSIGFNMEETEGVHSSTSLVSARDASYVAFIREMYAYFATRRTLTQNREIRTALQSIRAFERVHALKRKEENIPLRILTVQHDGRFSTFSPELAGVPLRGRESADLGNVRTSSLEEVLRSPRFQALRNEIERGVARCKAECAYFGVCGGGAPSNKWFELGSFEATETQCCRLRVKHLTEVVLENLSSPPAVA